MSYRRSETGKIDQSFVRAWNDALKSLDDAEGFGASIETLTLQLRDILGFDVQIVEQPIYKRYIHRFIVTTPILRLRIPRRFPLIYLRKKDVSAQDVRDINDGIETLLGEFASIERFAIVVCFNGSKDLQQLVRTSERKPDLVVLDRRNIYEILRAEEPRTQLVRIISAQLELTRISPYVTAGPVPSNMFFGRKDEIRRILQMLRSGSFVIVGGRRIGKTSLLHKLRELFDASTAEFLPLKLDCQATSTAQDFYRAVDMQSKLGLPRDRHDFVALVDELRRPSDQIPVILIDEIDSLLRNSYEGSEERKLIATFRQLSHTDECRFILFGGDVLYEKLYDPTSPVFNFGQEIILPQLGETGVKELIIEPMTQIDITFSDKDEFVERVIHFSSCYPNLVQRICRRSIEQLASTGSHHLTLDVLDKIVNSSDFDDDYLSAVWGNAGPLEKLISFVMVLNDTPVHRTLKSPRQGSKSNFRI